MIIGKDRGAALVQSVTVIGIITVVGDDLMNCIAILFNVELETHSASL